MPITNRVGFICYTIHEENIAIIKPKVSMVNSFPYAMYRNFVASVIRSVRAAEGILIGSDSVWPTITARMDIIKGG